MAQGQVAGHRGIRLHGFLLPLRRTSGVASLIWQRFLQIISSVENLDETLGSLDQPQWGRAGLHPQHPDILKPVAVNDNNKEKRRQRQKQASVVDVEKHKHESERYPIVDLVAKAQIQVGLDGVDAAEEADGQEMIVNWELGFKYNWWFEEHLYRWFTIRDLNGWYW